MLHQFAGRREHVRHGVIRCAGSRRWLGRWRLLNRWQVFLEDFTDSGLQIGKQGLVGKVVWSAVALHAIAILLGLLHEGLNWSQVAPFAAG